MADAAPVQRIVPGAPPPPPLSKSQKKKRKSVIKPKMADAPSAESILAVPDSKTSALVEKVSGEEDVKKGAVAEAPVALLEPISEVVQDKAKKASPAVELLNKRIKVQNKKLSRIAVYSSKPPSELNEDQRKSVASLPSIQGAVRELEETRKAIEALEAEEAKERARQHTEEERATNERIAQAVADATNSHQRRLFEILYLLRLSSLLATSDPTTFALTIDEKERQVLYVTAETLLGSEGPKKNEIINGLLLGQGDIDGIAYGRLLEVVDAHRNPPIEREATPTPEEPVVEAVQPVAAEEVADEAGETEPLPNVEAVVPPTSSGGFHFMQESELEGASFDHGVEWVEKPQETGETVATAPIVEAPEPLTVIDTGIPLGVNGVTKHLDEPPLSAVSAALDWAADDGDGLPSINSLHAKFGTSGAATPEALPQDVVPVTETPTVAAEHEWSGHKNTPNTIPGGDGDVGDAVDTWSAAPPGDTQVDEEGFVKAKGNNRGRQSDSRPEFRGRGRGGYRGDRGGDYRGGYRGRGGSDSFGSGWRGGDGEFRGRGGFRGDRGRGGDFRGGDFRGRGGRGGEFRGRGRGERGSYRGGRGGLEGNGEQGDRQPQPAQ